MRRAKVKLLNHGGYSGIDMADGFDFEFVHTGVINTQYGDDSWVDITLASLVEAGYRVDVGYPFGLTDDELREKTLGFDRDFYEFELIEILED